MKKQFKSVIILSILFYQNIASGSSLWWTEQMISFRFDVNNISHQQLQKLLPISESGEILLFDVRRPEEYQASRIKGSILISPEMSAEDFISQFISPNDKKIHAKTLIFYCSVGYRSSEFIQRIKQHGYQKDMSEMKNLKGGIFRWYNESYPVFNDKGETDEMHPSDESWADLIDYRLTE